MVYEDYLPCSAYEGQDSHATETGYVAFFHEESQRYFFALTDEQGVLLISEGYPQAPARENGIQSVNKNRGNRDFWSVKSEDGKYYLSLRAANYREIARTCMFDSEAEALGMLDYVSGEKSRMAAASAATARETASGREDDNYLACNDYAGHSGVDADGIVRFTHSDGEHYFAWVDATGRVLMRSEGYPTTAARDNGIASVLKNRDIEERWSVMERMGRYFAILKAGNHQEIARSCAYDSEAGARAYFPSSRRSSTTVERVTTVETITVQGEPTVITETRTLEPTIITEKVEIEEEVLVPVAAAATTIAATPPPPKDKEDDYLACKEYEGHHINDKVNNVALFKHSNGQYYFAIYNADGSVRLRSEGFSKANERDSELSGALRNLNNKEMYTTIEKGDYFIKVLKDKSGREVGRSCLMKEEPAPVVAPVAAVAAAAPVVERIIKKEKVDDDYMPCQEYKGHKVGANGISTFTHSNGQKYFVWYDADGGVKLRSEGFTNDADLQEELDLVLKYRDEKARWETIEKAGHRMHILKDPTGREIGRSCLEKIVVAPPVMAAAPPPPPVIETPIVETPKAGFNWWWLLLPLLALLAWWLMKDGCKAETPAIKVETPAPEPVKPEVNVVPPAPVAPAGCPSCTGASSDPIFTSVCDNPKKLSRLGTNPEFGNSHALSPEQFYQKLKKAHANNDVDKVFLDRVYRAMGYSGFADAKADQFSSVTLPVGTTGRLGYSKAHKTGCYTLPDDEYHRKAFHIKAANGCDLHFMKTCGNHFFFCSN